MTRVKTRSICVSPIVWLDLHVSQVASEPCKVTDHLCPTADDPKAGAKADWIQAKRHVLAVLRVQRGKTLFDVLVSRPEDIHEQLWIQEVHRDIALENARKARHGLPPAHVEAEYQIESIRS